MNFGILSFDKTMIGGHLEAMEVNHLMCWVPPNLSIHHLDLESSNI